jgi:protocatechuate 3,4-dioxygenase beta subunit
MKKDDKGISRRGLIGLAGSATILSAAGATALYASKADSDPTPPQIEGPFFPEDTDTESDADLTRLGKSPITATGKRLRIKGLVLGKHGQALEGAEVTLWQACHTGKYNHKDDPSTAALDPHFQYWAKVKADKDGTFSALTIEPGAYPVNPDVKNGWVRPPHIHFKVEHNGETLVTSQMYFKGHPLNAVDHLLISTRKQYGDAAAESLIVDFQKSSSGGVAEGKFVICVGTTVALD